jgi:AbrB family looped-hinge helix DNA binding protein
MVKKTGHNIFFGMTTVGEKGQVVVPAEARKRMDLKKGEKMIVFSPEDNMVVFCKANGLENLAMHLAKKLEAVNSIIKKSKV